MDLPRISAGKLNLNLFAIANQGKGRFALTGDLTFHSAQAALKASAVVFENNAAIVFDLGGLDRVDSAGIAVLVEWLRRGRQLGRTITYARIPEPVRALARVSGVEDLLESTGGEPETAPRTIVP
jgi:phospholipid transport system transporter-binding protein